MASTLFQGSWTRLLLLGVIYAIYLTLGAIIFAKIEAPEEQRLSYQVASMRADFLERHPCVKEEELKLLIIGLRDAWEFGLPAFASNDSLEISSWDFGSSFFFSTTLLTTIGFGAVTPLTPAGKLASILYTLIGIPLTFLFVSTLTYIFTKPTRAVLDKMMTKWDSYMPELGIRLIHLTALIILVACLFFVLPAFLFEYLEPGWGYLDAIYFTFISLTTVGLGDFVPGFDHNADYISQRTLYQIATSVYLIVGISMMFLIVEFCILIPTMGQLWDVVSPGASRKNSVTRDNEKGKLKESIQQLTEYSSLGDTNQ